MKNHLITLFICAMFVSPVFIYFSKDYKLLAEIVFAVWIGGYLFSYWDYHYFIKNKTDSYELTEDHENGWLLEYIADCCREINISRPPRVRINRTGDEAGIIGNKFWSTIVIGEEIFTKFETNVIMGIITHELGHLYFDHGLVRGFFHMFIFIPRAIIVNTYEIIDCLSAVLKFIPFIGDLTTIILLFLWHVAAAIGMMFLWIVSALKILTTRYSEYAADKFSYRLGAHEGVLVYFHLTEDEDKRSFFDFQIPEHPQTKKRKKKLLKYVIANDESYLNYDLNEAVLLNYNQQT